MTDCAALLVAAGRGHRVGGETPKQYLSIAGEPVLRHAARRFLAHPGVGAVLVVIHPDDAALYQAAVAGLNLPPPAFGGAERQDSVRNGLERLSESGAPAKVLIHDAVRPFVDADVITGVIEAVGPDRGAIPALPVADTLKHVQGGQVVATVGRAELWRAQTPQGFPFAPLLAAHRALAGKTFTDDSSIAEASGLAVAVVGGRESNFKITDAEDLSRADRLLAATRHTRIGTGFDVHAFEPGNAVMICGVEIAHTMKLAGHSDADVGLHALTDALLGAAGKGDIGVYFPPSDPKWKGAASDIFLKAAGDLIAADGGRIENLDVTIICEAPRIGPHRDAMRARVAGILGMAASRVNVKGKTTEKLGFLGRGEGIAAQAVASVSYKA